MSEDQFLAWAETQDGRFELVDGIVIKQAGATRNHKRVAKRIFVSLHAQVDESAFDVNKGDFGVRIRSGSGKGSILYPDVVIDLQSGTGRERATTTPVVVVEVLSAAETLRRAVGDSSVSAGRRVRIAGRGLPIPGG
jgi:Uma2 family endonuclease